MRCHGLLPTQLVSQAALTFVIAGCGGGTVVVDCVVDAQVTMRDSNGVEEPGTVVTVPRHPGPSSPMAVQYRGKDFAWTFEAGAQGMGGRIANHSADTVCLRFDQAHLRSNFHAEPIALRTYAWSTFREKWTLLGSTDPKQRRDFSPPSFCLEPGKQALISFGPDLAALFPTQKLFNVQWPDEEPNLSDKGVGNWVALSTPVETGPKRGILDVKLTAVDCKARISTH
jgi:hypothetical protein